MLRVEEIQPAARDASGKVLAATLQPSVQPNPKLKPNPSPNPNPNQVLDATL